jgi:hypothetical protein
MELKPSAKTVNQVLGQFRIGRHRHDEPCCRLRRHEDIAAHQVRDGSKNPTRSGADFGSPSGPFPPFNTARDRRRFDAMQLTSDTITQTGQAPPWASQRLPYPHRSVRGSSARLKNTSEQLRHIAEIRRHAFAGCCGASSCPSASRHPRPFPASEAFPNCRRSASRQLPNRWKLRNVLGWDIPVVPGSFRQRRLPSGSDFPVSSHRRPDTSMAGRLKADSFPEANSVERSFTPHSG